MVKAFSGMISREQAKMIALEDVNDWKYVKNAKVESIEKIHKEDDEFSHWEVKGIFVWNEVLSGSFIISILEDGTIKEPGASAAYPVPEGRIVPGPHNRKS
ncbi:MAG: hypothetical protein NWE89_03800 [Candidatus Bathyarchaeota archaeon]|nr:hypothetical protein [Candidatus Bathyarchaeota archaeon]